MKRIAIGLSVLALSGCASTHEDGSRNIDPWESYNRQVYAFNDKVDRYFMKPIAKGYQKVLPGFMQRGVNNFFDNFRLVTTVANDLLQFKMDDFANDTGRLVINSTIGVLGMYDWAAEWGLEPHYEDFGQTLASWGYEDSRYWVIPFIGPSTVRDGIGMSVDHNFLSVYAYIDEDRTRYALKALDLIDYRASLLKAETVAKSAAVDEYIMVRDAFLQNRDHQIRDGALEEDDDFIDFEDDEFDDYDY